MSVNFNVSLAGVNVNITAQSDFLQKFCGEYVTVEKEADITVNITRDMIKEQKLLSPDLPERYCESLCAYREIAERLPFYERFVFHGAAIEYKKRGYIFTAPSGTGKTTHINLWRKYLGDKVSVINGDKPIISVADTATVYGSAWAGKENLQSNISAPIKAICIIKQSKENKITRIDNSEAINHLIRQIYLPTKSNALGTTLTLLGRLIENTSVYILNCDISQQAFTAAFEELIK